MEDIFINQNENDQETQPTMNETEAPQQSVLGITKQIQKPKKQAHKVGDKLTAEE